MTPDAAERRARARVAARGHDIVTTGHVIEWPASGCARMTERETRTHIPGEPDEADRDVLSLADALRAAEARAVAAERERDAATEAARDDHEASMGWARHAREEETMREAADARHAALAAATTEYMAVALAMVESGIGDATLARARVAHDTLDALLRGAPGGYVEARVVRERCAAIAEEFGRVRAADWATAQAIADAIRKGDDR